MEQEFVESILKNWVVLSIGTKGSGKTYLMLKYLKFAFQNNLYEKYVLVLPMFNMEQNDSYSFIDANQKNIFVFDTYNEVIASQLYKEQEKAGAKGSKPKTLFCIDDASGEDVKIIDHSLKRLITNIRHTNTALWMCVHSASGILSPFIRQQTDILFLSKIGNARLLESIWEEFLSLMEGYQGREGHKAFTNKFIEVHKSKYQVIYMNIRTGSIDYTVSEWNFDNLTDNNIDNDLHVGICKRTKQRKSVQQEVLQKR